MQLVHAIFERGVFRPTGVVNLPDGCEVEFEPHLSPPRMTTDSKQFVLRLNELRSLQNGWLDGKGLAPACIGLDWLANEFASNYSTDLPQPFVYPTAEGGVQLEWTIGDHEASLEIDLTSHQAQWHCVNLKTESDSIRDVDLDDVRNWTRLNDEIGQLAGGAS